MSFNWNNIEEPIRSVANKVAVLVTTLSVILISLNQFIDYLPSAYRVKASAILATATAISIVIIKIAGEVGRSKVTPVATLPGKE